MSPIKTKHRVIGWVLFLIYLCFLSYFLFFAEALGRNGNQEEQCRYNLVLFREICRFYRYRHVVGMRAFFLNTFGNVLAFIPFGFFVPIIEKRKHSFFRILFSGMIFSTLIEVTQFYTGAGSFDVDDIFLNTCGSLLGYLIFVVLLHMKRKKSEQT